MPAPRTHRFGPFVLDSAAFELRRDDRPVPMQAKALELLLLLVERPGVLHEREALRQALWPDVRVTDQSLYQVVHKLRSALGDGYVETVPRKGLRFAAPVEVDATGPGYAALPWSAGPAHALERARVRLAEGDVDGAWALLAPMLGEGALDEQVVRTAIEIRLARGEARLARDLWKRADRPADPDAVQPGTPPWEVAAVLALDPEPLEIEAVAAVLDAPPSGIASAVQALHQVGWLLPDGALAPGLAAALVEAVAPQVVRRHHAALALALGEPPSRVARHHEAAGQLEAAHRLYRAEADRTGAVSSYEAALRTAPPDEHELLVAAIRAAVRVTDLERARRWLEALRQLGVHTQRPAVLLAGALQTALLGTCEGATEAARDALDEAATLGGSAAEIGALRGILLTREGRLDEAAEHYTAALAGVGNTRLMGLNGLGALAAMRGDSAGADALHEEALAEARAQGSLPTVGRLLNSIGADAHRAHQLERAAERLRECVDLARHIDDGFLARMAELNLANVLLDLGRLGEARTSIGDRLVAAVTDVDRAASYRLRANLEREAGRFEEAAAWSARAVAVYRLVGDAPLEALEGFNEALAAYCADRTDLEPLRLALDVLQQRGRPDLYGMAAAEASLCEDTPDAAEALLAASTAPRALLARARVAVMRGEELPAEAGAHVGRGTLQGLDGVYLDLLAVRAGEERRALVEGARRRVAAFGEGLLSDQQAALRQRLSGWLEAAVERW
ncbi:MAG: winged helix-turn-helix domain-containing protein [Myxococcota bacterium]